MSVMLLDCSRLDWRIEDVVRGLDEGRYSYSQLMFDLCLAAPNEIADRIPPEWNCLEWHDPARTKLLHYTVVPTQPWKNDDNPLRAIWENQYREAVSVHAVSVEEVVDGVQCGHLKGSLLDAFTHSDVEAAAKALQKRRAMRLFGKYTPRRLAGAARRALLKGSRTTGAAIRDTLQKLQKAG